jgi:hypothetical protein
MDEWEVHEGDPSWHQRRAGHISAAVTGGFKSKAEAEEYAERMRSKRGSAARIFVLKSRTKQGLGNMPAWPGASQAYSHLYKVLEKMGADNYKAEVAAARKRGRKPRPPQPTEEMKEIMEALDAGDEERVKGLKLRYLNEGFGDLPRWVR